jgi:hypothetical protein
MPDIKLHIFSIKQVYNKALLDFFHKNLDLQNHHFIFLFKPDNEISGTDNENIIYKPGYSGLLQAIKLARQSDFIFFHSLPMGPKVIIWAMFPSIFRKSVWIYWGADIYAFRNRRKNLKHVIYDFCRRRIITEIPHIAGFLEGDFRLIKENYHTEAAYHHVVYQLPTSFELIDHLRPGIQKKTGSKIKVLLGNSASQTNLHLEALQKLEKYKEEDIEIICPLSYGVKKSAYLHQVISRGKAIFGERFIPLLQFMEPAQYLDLLAGIDIAVMNHNRQEALGNIISLLYMGKKVYIDAGTTSFSYFRRNNIKIFDINEIRKIPFSEFTRTETDELTNNANILRNELSQQNYIKWWKELTSLS